MEPSTPPRASNPPPPPRGGAPGRFQRTHVVEQSSSSPTTAATTVATALPASPPTVPPRHPSSPKKQQSEEIVSDASSEAEGNLNAVIPAGLTEDAVQRAFGTAAEASTSPAAANKAADGSPSRGSAGRRPGGIIMPTRKEGSDSVSMYSMSQSVLPLDPRERIYYRPRRHLLQCYVQRKKQQGLGISSLLPGSHKSFHFFLEHTNDFVLAAVPRNMKSQSMVEDTSDGVGGHFYAVSKGGGNIVFTVNQQQLDNDVRSFVGKLSRRGSGLEMVMFSEGDKATRKELVAVLLENFEDTSRSSFTVVLPAIDVESGYIKPIEGGEVKFLRDGRGTASVAGGSRAGIDAAMAESSDDDVDATMSTMAKAAPKFAAVDETSGAGGAPPSSEGAVDTSGRLLGSQKKWRSHSVLAREYKRDPRSPHIIVLKNKVPQWDAVLRGYKLDFHGRATKASEKNFQLVAATDPEKVVMLFGKQGDDRFALDFRYPLCGLQAAAIATTIMTARKVIK
jgi:tubby and related proteins